MITLKDALTLVLDHSFPLGTELIHYTETLGRISASQIISEMNVPPFDRSPLDGYALIAEDTFGASPEEPVALNVIGDLKKKDMIIKSGTCMRIFTGEPFPRGADTVVPQEKVMRKGNTLLLTMPFQPGSNVARAGEDISRGSAILEPGTLIDSVHLGILSSLGIQDIRVFKKPTAAVLATGYELKNCGEELLFGQIYDCNTPMLCALISRCAAIPVPLGIVKDNIETLASILEKALAENDQNISTGGVSVGDYDLVANALEKIGARVLFWRVAMKPGTPVLVATKGGKLIFCLPGNPAAAFVSFEQLVRPSLFEMVCYKGWQRPETTAVLEHSIPASGSQNRFIRAICSLDKNGFKVRSAGLERSGVLSSFKDANALIYLPAGTLPLQTGEKVTVQLLDLPVTQKVAANIFA